MTWLTGKRGIQYHWLLDLFRRLRLPLFDGMEEALKKANEERAKKLEKIKTDVSKKKDWTEKEERNRTRGKETMVTGTRDKSWIWRQ